jgi:hypothetical protein
VYQDGDGGWVGEVNVEEMRRRGAMDWAKPLCARNMAAQIVKMRGISRMGDVDLGGSVLIEGEYRGVGGFGIVGWAEELAVVEE